MRCRQSSSAHTRSGSGRLRAQSSSSMNPFLLAAALVLSLRSCPPGVLMAASVWVCLCVSAPIRIIRTVHSLIGLLFGRIAG